MATNVFDDSDKVLDGVKVTKVSVMRKSRLLKAPLEDGRISIDDKVIDPIEVIVNGVIKVNDSKTMTSLMKMQASRDYKFYRVMNNDIVIVRLMLENFKHENNKETPDLVDIELAYVEAMLIQTHRFSHKNTDKSPTMKSLEKLALGGFSLSDAQVGAMVGKGTIVGK